MLNEEFTAQFKRDYKLAVKRGCNPQKLEAVIRLLRTEAPLPEVYRDHALTNSKNCRKKPSGNPKRWVLLWAEKS